MLNLNLPELSSTAGPLDDGVVRGSLQPSQIIALFHNACHSRTNLVYRNADSVITDLSNESMSGVGTFQPFGQTDDQLFIAAEGVIDEIYFDIVTPSIWSGTGFSLWDSFDGHTANRRLNIISDETDGLRASPGVRRIVFEQPEIPGLEFTISPDLPKAKWLVLKLENFISAAVVATCARLWLKVDASVSRYTSLTDEVIADPSSPLFDKVSEQHLAMAGSNILVSLPFTSFGLNLTIYRQTTEDTNLAYEYFSADGSWRELPNLSDESNGLKNGPSSLGILGLPYKVRWSLPTDWKQSALVVALEGDDLITLSGFIIRIKVVAVNSYAPTLRPLFRSKCLSYGEDYSKGLYHKHKTTYSIATYDVGVPSAQDTIIRLSNINQAKEAILTIPAYSISSIDRADGFIPLDRFLEIEANESLMISHLSGGVLQDVELNLQ